MAPARQLTFKHVEHIGVGIDLAVIAHEFAEWTVLRPDTGPDLSLDDDLGVDRHLEIHTPTPIHFQRTAVYTRGDGEFVHVYRHGRTSGDEHRRRCANKNSDIQRFSGGLRLGLIFG